MSRVHDDPLGRGLHRAVGGEIARRDVLTVGVLSAFGLTQAAASRLRAEVPAASGRRPRRTARSCILVWLDGGPSHLETFDPKSDAPREVRGPFAPMATAVPGLQISELMPATAKLAGRLAIVRSMTSPLGEHNFGSHYLLTGYRPTPALTYPSLGSVKASFAERRGALPPFVGVGDRANTMDGPGYLPGACAPFLPGGDPARPGFKVRDLDLFPAVTEERLRRRRRFLSDLDAFARTVENAAGESEEAQEFERAYRLVTTKEARQAFDLDQESDATRSRYGRRTLGQSCLLARRLVERGVSFVTVTDRGWDTHTDLRLRLMEGYTGGSVGKIPVLDQALAALLSDLEVRGLLDETLVLVMGEFGRTPKINTSRGRDHWPRVFSVAVAGAGVPGGQVIGSSDAHAESPKDRPITPGELTRTVYTILGIDPDHEFVTADRRPVRVSLDVPLVRELIG